MSIGQRISKLMLDMDVSNAKLARMIGVSRPTIGNWIEGKSAPTGENLTNLANALKVDPNWLMSGKESQARLDNNVDTSQKIPFDFLNGVCRHERTFGIRLERATFLNGVCRHELF